MIKVEGKKIAQKMLAEIAGKVGNPRQPLILAAVLVGDINNARKFLEVKKKAAENIGIGFNIHEFPEDISQNELEDRLKIISADTKNNGIIIELPLPKHLNQQKLLDLIPPDRDPDVLSSKAQELFYNNESLILPPAVEATKQIFDEYGIELKNKNAAVFGQGILVGKPIGHWLRMQGTGVNIIDEFTPEPEKISIDADVIISGVGHPNLIMPDMVKDKVILIDFGFNQADGGIVGDASMETTQKTSLFTPVPGGVGPIVVAAVLKNLIILYQSNE
ncbi:MAG: bifunctional 5,10-methylenetetrahydrofolate dehydrogenase/5,10-methenyltetrahydrofolate cyclohydrolase [bacterium]|nr:bifunctional 5,10-methylenetetrahydrofolate dehydrogenase/5,10-methenyltetrahydrofolate cyclohydrolase [bacterium]